MAPSRIAEDDSSSDFIPPLQVFAEQIRDAALLIGNYCTKTGIPHPSLGPQAPLLQLPKGTPEHVLRARSLIHSTAFKLQQAAVEPGEFIPNLATGYQSLACIRWLCKFRIMFAVPRHGSIPYAAVAEAAGVSAAPLKSIARMAMLNNFFCEPVPGELANSSLSLRFVDDPSLIDWILYLAEIGAPVAANMVEATEKWGETIDKAQTAVNLFFNTDLPMFDFFASRPDLTKKFAGYMKNATRSPGTSPQHIVDGFDWASVGNGTVVDVGGSNCHITIALAQAFPELHFIVQDLPTTVANTPAILKDLPHHISTRITAQAYDFFQPQPVSGALVYLFRTIFHDWPDHDAVKILRNQIPALSVNSKSRLLIMDIVLPVPGSVDVQEESLLRVQDLKMMQSFNAYEREVEDWDRLLQEASREPQLGRLVLRSVTKPFGSLLSLLEIAVEN